MLGRSQKDSPPMSRSTHALARECAGIAIGASAGLLALAMLALAVVERGVMP